MEIFLKGMEEIESKGSWMGEIGQVRKNNTTFPSYMSLTLLRDEHDNPIGSLCVTRDITVRKRMEEELKRYTEHLEEEVKLRAYDLIQSEKMASLGQLVAGVAHEINNPLGYLSSNTEVIGEYLESLLRTIKDKKTQKIIQDITKLMATNFKGINRISKITKSLERFAIPTRSEKIRSDINQGLKDTLQILSNQFKRQIIIKTDYGEIPKIVCNISQLNQVFTNIIQNASEALNSGNIWIKTWCDEHNVFIEIEDNGKGISNEIINKIFDPFFTTKEGCTGLGLSVSFRIIQSYGGNIKVESEVGSGTKIIINIPRVKKND
jgi:signal transduction histidine kinase